MKLKFLFIFYCGLLVLPFTNCISQESAFNIGFEALLKKHNTGHSFDYSAVSSEEITILNGLLADLEGTDFMDPVTSTATKVNVYNYLVIREIIAEYPVASVAEINNFFTKSIDIGLGELNLDELEKSIIITGKNPYLHFLLNCGAKGCPRLQYIAPDQAIEPYISRALSDKHLLNTKENTTYLSQIFFWNKAEFGDEESMIKELSRLTDQKLNPANSIAYQDYDWLLNDLNSTEASNQTFYPTKLYSKGGGELKIFNNYYTQTENGNRANFFSSFLQLLIGTNKNLNLGVDIKLRSVTQGKVSTFSALRFQNKAFYLNEGSTSFARVGISAIGPRIKYQPFKSKNNINILHTLYFVPMESAQGNEQYGYSDYNYLQLFNQIYYEKEFSVKRRLFIDLGLHIENLRLSGNTSEDHFMPIQLPVTVIYSYFPDSKMTLYGLGSFGQRLDIVFPSGAGNYSNYTVYGQLGAGIKYYLTDFLEAELLYTNFLDTTPGRTAHTYNLGLRFFRL